MVIDQPQHNRSSIIAAGLFNPITGKLMTKTWQADLLFNELHEFYSQAEKQLEARFFYSQPIYRPFISIEEQNEWMGKSADASLSTYIDKIFTESRYSHQVNDPFGGLMLRQSGYLDTHIFLESVRNKLKNIQSFADEKFEEESLTIHRAHVQYKHITAKKIIFCTGTAQINSNILLNVPIRPLKGETLLIETTQQPEQIYNRGVFIVPANEINRYRVGSTYESKMLTETVTEAGRLELVMKLNELLKIPFKTVGQDWGIRPTSPDRKPMLGCLNGLENVVVFNGLGTKGVSLAPYFSKHLADWLLGKCKLQPEVNISRFKSLSSKFSEVV
jgi:glycine/D-amino acid oxidase-like deaminating enzyme